MTCFCNVVNRVCAKLNSCCVFDKQLFKVCSLASKTKCHEIMLLLWTVSIIIGDFPWNTDKYRSKQNGFSFFLSAQKDAFVWRLVCRAVKQICSAGMLICIFVSVHDKWQMTYKSHKLNMVQKVGVVCEINEYPRGMWWNRDIFAICFLLETNKQIKHIITMVLYLLFQKQRSKNKIQTVTQIYIPLRTILELFAPQPN